MLVKTKTVWVILDSICMVQFTETGGLIFTSAGRPVEVSKADAEYISEKWEQFIRDEAEAELFDEIEEEEEEIEA